MKKRNIGTCEKIYENNEKIVFNGHSVCYMKCTATANNGTVNERTNCKKKDGEDEQKRSDSQTHKTQQKRTTSEKQFTRCATAIGLIKMHFSR